MPISFNQIPIDLRVPGVYVEFDNSKAVNGLQPIPNKILVLGQRLAAGTVPANVPQLVSTADQAVTFFGRGSMLAAMFAALKKGNPWTESWAIALDDNAAGTAATGSIKITAPPTADGTLTVYIAGTAVQVAVTAAETAAAIATSLQAAIAALPDLPVTAAVDGVDTAKVNLTARHKGENGNTIDIRATYYARDALPAGLTLAITAMAAGAGNPALAAAIAATGDDWYNSWILPYTDGASLAAVAAELDRRFGPLVMKEGHAYAASVGTLGALAAFGGGQNTPHISTIGVNKNVQPDYVWAAALGGIAAYYGNIDPARPLQTLPLTGVMAPARTDRFIQSERDTLLHDGIATFTVDDDGTVRIERAITMYRENAAGLPDVSYLDTETLLTLFYLRFTLRARIAQRFPRYKLADDGTRFGAGQAIVTPSIVRAEILALFAEWENVGLVENVDQFKSDLVVERDPNDHNRVNALVPPDLINQLRVVAAQIQFRL